MNVHVLLYKQKTENSHKFMYSSGVDDVHMPGSRYCLEGCNVLYRRGQTGFLNFYSINYMISGFEGMEASRDECFLSRKTLKKAECLT